jgi:hypothetical protein
MRRQESAGVVCGVVVLNLFVCVRDDFGTTKQPPCTSSPIMWETSLSLYLVKPTKQINNKFGVVWWDWTRMVPNPNQIIFLKNPNNQVKYSHNIPNYSSFFFIIFFSFEKTIWENFSISKREYTFCQSHHQGTMVITWLGGRRILTCPPIPNPTKKNKQIL